MTYGKKIASLRKSKGMTQEELGKVLNVTYQAVSKWERGESMPDFMMMSQIAKFFQVPLNYFEEGGEIRQDIEAAADKDERAEKSKIIGMCTVCGKMLEEDEAAQISPKIVCNNCQERQRQEESRARQAREAIAERQAERIKRSQLGSGFDIKLIVAIVLALASYIGLTVYCFLCESDIRGLIVILLLLVPLAVFAIVLAIADFINELRDKDDDADGYKLNLSLIVGGAFAVVNVILFLTLFLCFDKNVFYIGLLFIGLVASFTFVSQYMWGNVVREMFTCGGFTFKLPGFIFSLSIDSILLMIVLKILLGIIAILVFIATTIFFAVVAMLGSVITFIPSVIIKSVKDKKA